MTEQARKAVEDLREALEDTNRGGTLHIEPDELIPHCEAVAALDDETLQDLAEVARKLAALLDSLSNDDLREFGELKRAYFRHADTVS